MLSLTNDLIRAIEERNVFTKFGKKLVHNFHYWSAHTNIVKSPQTVLCAPGSVLILWSRHIVSCRKGHPNR